MFREISRVNIRELFFSQMKEICIHFHIHLILILSPISIDNTLSDWHAIHQYFFHLLLLSERTTSKGSCSHLQRATITIKLCPVNQWKIPQTLIFHWSNKPLCLLYGSQYLCYIQIFFQANLDTRINNEMPTIKGTLCTLRYWYNSSTTIVFFSDVHGV